MLAVLVAFGADLEGNYKGTWSGNAGASGNIKMSFTTGKVEVTFTLADQDVKTKVTSFEVNGAKMKVVYQFDLQGAVLESTATGELKDGTLAGEYHTKAVADGSAVDDGTWKTTQ